MGSGQGWNRAGGFADRHIAGPDARGWAHRSYRLEALAVAIAAIVVALCCAASSTWCRRSARSSSHNRRSALASAIFPPAIAALTLGVVGRSLLARQTGRNEAFNHAGNVVAAALAGLGAYFLGYPAMFVLVAGMAAASAVAVMLIREKDIDHKLARRADDGANLLAARPSACGNSFATGGSPFSWRQPCCSISQTRPCCPWPDRNRVMDSRKGPPWCSQRASSPLKWSWCRSH